MLKEISLRQFLEWKLYSDLEPFDEMRGDYRAARIAQTVANASRGPNTAAYGLTDFLIYADPDAPQKSEDELKTIARCIVAAYATPETS